MPGTRPVSSASRRDNVRLGNLTLKVAIHLLRFASAVKCVPFKVTSGTEFRVSVFGHEWERRLWYTVIAVVYVHAAFQITTVSHNIFSTGLTGDNALQLVCSSLCVISVVFYENALRHSTGTVACINQLQRLQELNRGLGFRCRAWYCNSFVILTLNYFAILGFGGPVGVPAICLFYPNDPLFIYYVIPENFKTYMLAFPVVIVLEMLIWTWTWTILTAAYCWWCGMIFQNLLLLDTMGRPQSKGWMSFTSVAKDVKMYQHLQAYNSLYNYVNADFRARYNAITCIVAVVMLYGSIKAYKLLSFVLYSLFPLSALMAVVCLTAMNGHTYLLERKSSQVLSAMEMNASRVARMGTRNVQMILRRQLRAMRPLRTKEGMYGHTCLELPQAEMAQIFNYIVLLLRY